MRNRSRKSKRSGRRGRRSSEETKQKAPRRMPNKLFVGNLSRTVSKSEVEREFSRFGRLSDVWISQKPPGFAFVEFLNSKDATECVQALDGRSLLGTRLRVEFAKNEPVAVKRRSGRKRSKTSRGLGSLSPLPGGLSPGDLARPSALALAAAARLLPPPKPGSSMLNPVYDRSPSPILLPGHSGLLYDELGAYSALDASRLARVQASLLLPALRARSRSPRSRSPLALPAMSRDVLSTSGRLLAPPLPPPMSALYSSAAYALGHGDFTPPHIKRYSSHGRSPLKYRSRSPLPGRSRSPARDGSHNHQRVLRTSGSQTPDRLLPRQPKGRLLGRTPPLPDRSPSPKRYRSPASASRSRERDSLHRHRSRSFSQSMSRSSQSASPHYSRTRVPGAYTPPSPPPATKNSTYSPSPVRKHVSPPPKAYALPGDRNSSHSWSRSRSHSVPGRMSSSSPRRKMRQSSSSSCSRSPPARYARSPSLVKRETSSPSRRDLSRGKMSQMHGRSPSLPKRGRSRSPLPARHHRSPTPTKHARSPLPVRHDRNVSSSRRDVDVSTHRRGSPEVRGHTSEKHASPVSLYSKSDSHRSARRSSPAQNSAQWSPVARRSNRSAQRSLSRSPPPTAKNGGRSPVGRQHLSSTSEVASRTSRSSAHARSPPTTSRSDRRSPRRHR